MNTNGHHGHYGHYEHYGHYGHLDTMDTMDRHYGHFDYSAEEFPHFQFFNGRSVRLELLFSCYQIR